MPEFDAFKTALQRAVEDGDGIENLSKTEAIYFVEYKLTGDMPEGHPDDHNGNVTREQVKSWAEALAGDD